MRPPLRKSNFLSFQLPSTSNSSKGSSILLPTMVFIHGGAFYVGSSTDYGPSYLMEQDIILVTLNYRLGVFGFFSDGTTASPGNWGLKDQSLAIDFVSKYIHHFGGDAKKLLLFGQSAGASSTHFQVMSSYLQTKTKISAAISISGTAFNTWSLRPSREMVPLAVRIAVLNGCRPELGSQYMMDCLRGHSPQNITTAASLATIMERRLFLPVIEPEGVGPSSAFLTKSPRNLYKMGEVQKVPYIFTMTSRELELGLGKKKSLNQSESFVSFKSQ